MLVSLLLGFGVFVSRSSAGVLGIFFLALFLCGRALFQVVTSASFGAPVPFAMWLPFGTSQGLLGPLSHSGLKVPFTRWSPAGSCLRFSFFSDSFASKVPFVMWSPFGMSLASVGTLSFRSPVP